MITFDYRNAADLTKKYFTEADTAAALTAGPVDNDAETGSPQVRENFIQNKRGVLIAAFTRGAYSPSGLWASHQYQLNEGDHIVVLRRNGVTVVPAFQFGKFECVRDINELLGAASDPFGVGDWWLCEHSSLIGRPELVARNLAPCPASLVGLEVQMAVPTGFSPDGVTYVSPDEMLMGLAKSLLAD